MTAHGDSTRPDGGAPDRERLIVGITQIAARSPQILPLVFTPASVPHPMSDAVDVFHHAAGQLLRRPDEHPLAFFGAHSQNRFTRSREAVGFLLTDRAIHVRDSPSGLFGETVPRTVPLISGPDGVAASATAAVSSATATFEWSWAEAVVTPDNRSLFVQALTEAVVLVLDHDAATGGTLPTAPPPAAVDLRDRVEELGLTSHVKYPDDPKHRKHFAKFVKTFDLPPDELVAFSLTDQTFLGVYGVVATDRALRSRNLMEPPVSTPLAEVAGAEVRIEGDHLLAGNVHTVPAFLTDPEKAALVTLATEFAAGALRW